MRKQRCYIYTRVSTAMQVDGFSLDAQKDKKKYADYQNMVVVREFTAEEIIKQQIAKKLLHRTNGRVIVLCRIKKIGILGGVFI